MPEGTVVVIGVWYSIRQYLVLAHQFVFDGEAVMTTAPLEAHVLHVLTNMRRIQLSKN